MVFIVAFLLRVGFTDIKSASVNHPEMIFRRMTTISSRLMPPAASACRSVEIYQRLDGESRALLLAAAERLDRGEQAVSSVDVDRRKTI